MMRLIKSVGIGFSLFTLVAATGCASPASEGAGDPMQDTDLTAGKKVVSDKTTSFGGSFAFDYFAPDVAAPVEVKMTFVISKIDWAAGTAVFDTTIVDSGDATVFEDEALPVTIEKGPCDGCHSFFAPQSDGPPAIDVRFTDSKLSSMTYFGLPTIGAKVTTASAEPLADAEGVGQPCGAMMAGARCFGTLVCDESLGPYKGRCVQPR